MTRKQLLIDTQISLDSPGTILRDFNMLLDYIGIDGIETSGKFHLFAMKYLGELNARLCHPIRVALKRPLQKSYPSIQGLYLLLRGTGLVRFIPRGKKTFLTLDAAAFDAWKRLNPSEQYFTLLETWLSAMDSSLVESNWGGYLDNSLMHFTDFYARLGKKTLDLDEDPSEHMRRLGHSPGLHNLALMRLFGLLEIGDADPKAGEGWTIRSISPTRFGDALLWRLKQADIANTILTYNEPDSGADQRQWFMTKFRPLFPELQHHLELPGANRLAGTNYTLRVTLPECCEGRFQLTGDTLLEALSEAILDMVAFDRDHLYSFYYRDRRGQRREVSHPYMSNSVSTTEVTLDALQLMEGQEFTYVYDFGDHWEFHIAVEKIEDGASGAAAEVSLLDFSGEAPSQYGDEGWDED